MSNNTAPAESLLPYSHWTEEALRLVVQDALSHAAEHGLPGDHHFYLTFRTAHPGVAMPGHLRARYPQEMTIVLQHKFWDLAVDKAGRDLLRPAVLRRRGGAADRALRGADRLRRPACPLRPAVRERRRPLPPSSSSPRRRAARRGDGGRRRSAAGGEPRRLPPPPDARLIAYRRDGRRGWLDRGPGLIRRDPSAPPPSPAPAPAARRRPVTSSSPRHPHPRRLLRRGGRRRHARRAGPEGLPVQPDVPAGRGPHALAAPAHRGRLDGRGRRQAGGEGAGPRAGGPGLPGLQGGVPPAAARPPRAARQDPARPGGQRQRPLRRARPAEERQHRRRRRAAHVPGHRHRHRVRQEGPARLGGGRRGGGALLRRPPHLHRDQPALFADGAALHVRGGEHRQQPAGGVLHHGAARRRPAPRRRAAPDVRAEGRRQRQQDLPLPADPRGAEQAEAARLPGREDQDARHLRLPALPPGDRHRRHLGRGQPEDGEAGQHALARHPADRGQPRRPRLPRPGAGRRRSTS